MLKPGVRVFFVRHGETDWNAEGRMQGQQDVPLNALGREQARAVAGKLRGAAPDITDLAYIASPMVRARETMEILRRELALEPTRYLTDERLKELTFGDWEGLTWKEVRKAHPAAAAARQADKWGYVPPNGESYAMLAERIAGWLPSISRDSVVIAHGGVARAMLNLVAAVPPERAPLVDIWQGRLILFQNGAYRWH